MATDVETWEARAGLDVGVLIRSYLLTHPAPGPSKLGYHLQSSTDLLIGAGSRAIDRQGQPRLRAVGGGE